MSNKKKTENAVRILLDRFAGNHPQREESLEEERVHAQAARTIYELRQEAGLSQKQLADMIGTTQSVISRLEDADYEGHSLSMLNRIAEALDKKLTVRMVGKNQ